MRRKKTGKIEQEENRLENEQITMRNKNTSRQAAKNRTRGAWPKEMLIMIFLFYFLH